MVVRASLEVKVAAEKVALACVMATVAATEAVRVACELDADAACSAWLEKSQCFGVCWSNCKGFREQISLQGFLLSYLLRRDAKLLSSDAYSAVQSTYAVQSCTPNKV